MRAAAALSDSPYWRVSAPQEFFNAYLRALGGKTATRLYLRGTAWRVTVVAALWRAALQVFPDCEPKVDGTSGATVVELVNPADATVALAGAHADEPWPNEVYRTADAILNRSARLAVLLTYFGSPGLATFEELASLMREALGKHPAASLLLIAADRTLPQDSSSGVRPAYRAVVFSPMTERVELTRATAAQK